MKDWLSEYMGWILLVGILLLAFLAAQTELRY